jgi:hypothetical protein
MKFLTLYRPESGVEGAAPDAEHMAAMGRLIEEMTANGSLVETGPLAPRAACAKVRLADDGSFSVSDTPDRIGGWAFINAESKEEAIELTKTFLRVAGGGVSELRQVAEFGPPPN